MSEDRTRPAEWALWLAPAAILGVMGYSRRWLSDDAFVGLRVVSNLMAGNGPVFNAAERVEAFSSPLWIGLLWLWGELGGSLEAGAAVLGWTLSVAGLLFGQAGARILARERLGPTAQLVPMGALAFACLPPAWDYVTSGVESGLTTFWLGFTFWLLCREVGAGPSKACALVLGLGPLVRPELLTFSAAFLAAHLAIAARSCGAGALANHASTAAAIPLGYQVFRMGYYASLGPNAALAREAGAVAWRHGFRYFEDFTATYLLLLPLLCLSLALAAAARGGPRDGRLRDWVAGASLVAATVLGMLVARSGGDYVHARMYLPVLFGFLLPMMAIEFERPIRGPREAIKASAVSLTLLWCIGCSSFLRVSYEGQIGHHGIADERGLYFASGASSAPISVSDFESHETHKAGSALGEPSISGRVAIVEPPDGELPFRVPARDECRPLKPGYARLGAVAAYWKPGLAGYIAGIRIHFVDRYGRTDPLGARLRVSHRGRPSHEKWLREPWILARFTEPWSDEPQNLTDARRVMRHPLLVELFDAIEQPLTFERFRRNLSVAFVLDELRVPPDPSEAAKNGL